MSVEERINELLINLDQMLPRVSKSEEINEPLCQEVVLQLNNLLKSDNFNSIKSQVIPFTPITKTKVAKFQEFPAETPINTNNLSRSRTKEDTKPQAPEAAADDLSNLSDHVKKWTEYFYSILETKSIP
jgi:hypothetical protein